MTVMNVGELFFPTTSQCRLKFLIFARKAITDFCLLYALPIITQYSIFLLSRFTSALLQTYKTMFV